MVCRRRESGIENTTEDRTKTRQLVTDEDDCNLCDSFRGGVLISLAFYLHQSHRRRHARPGYASSTFGSCSSAEQLGQGRESRRDEEDGMKQEGRKDQSGRKVRQGQRREG